MVLSKVGSEKNINKILTITKHTKNNIISKNKYNNIQLISFQYETLNMS